MRNYFVLAIIICLNSTSSNAQARFVSHDYKDYYDWFHQRSQVGLLYTNGASLYTFALSKVKAMACTDSETLLRLPIGSKITNIVDISEDFVQDNINGYDDIWFHVKGEDARHQFFEGYIWGADIAKSWQSVDITGDGINEFVLLGISSKKRKRPTDINATLKVLKNGKILSQTTVPGLCLFEECAASSLLRILKDQPVKGAIIIEASTMTIGCTAGVEKVYYFWNATQKLERVFHAEFTTNKQLRNKSFEFRGEEGLILCRFKHEDKNYNPVWEVKKVDSTQNTIAKTTRKKSRA